MKFKLTVPKNRGHGDNATALGWTAANDLFSLGDDHTIMRWSQTAEDVAAVETLSSDWFPTAMAWFPAGLQNAPSDLFAAGSADGRFRLVSRAGRVEKTIEAHQGALIDLKWALDGSALVTVGEDGHVKAWSRSGMLRSVLSKTGCPIYAVAWGPAYDRVLHTAGNKLVIKPLAPSAKVEQWKAHDGLAVVVDWNPVNNLIVSGGEDRRYKVWDAFGRVLYSSAPHEHPITSVRWNQDGSLFAVGAFNTLRLCDQAGWSHCLEKPGGTGSVYSIAWTTDGTQLAAACASGQVLFAHVLDRRVESKSTEVVLTAEDIIVARDVATGNTEKLDFRDRVVRMSLAYDHLVVTTTTQCLVYNTKRWTSPTSIDLRGGAVTLIQQSAHHLLLADKVNGLQLYSYEGRMLSSPKLPNTRSEKFNDFTVALSDDTVAILDHSNERLVHLFDVQTGKSLGQTLKHARDIAEVHLEQGKTASRHIAIVDKNRDLYLAHARRTAHRLEKLGTMVQSLAWHDSSCMLAAMSDGKLTVWYSPSTVFVDQDILPKTIHEKSASAYGTNPSITSFAGNRVNIRRADGAQQCANVSPHPALIHQYANGKKWADAVRLARFVKEPSIWACLAGIAAASKQLDTAEIAYAAIDEVDKVRYLQYIKSIPTAEGRNAEVALLCHQPDEAEAILLQAGLIYRAVDMNRTIHRWDRALEIALKYKTHIDTIIALRKRYLDRLDKPETSPSFLRYSDSVAVDWEQIQAKIAAEEEKERARPGAKPYAP